MSSGDFVRVGDGKSRLVMLPGWGTDHRIFGELDLPAGALLGRVPRPESVEHVLDACGPDGAVLLGWSLGGFWAAEAAARRPTAVGRLVLIGVRRSYPADAVDEMLQELNRDPAACLRDFYRRCFLPAQRADYRRFRSGLMESYLESPDVERLRDGLRYLREVELDEDGLPPVPTTLVHGTWDAVAPVDEARSIATAAPRTTFCPVEEAGHAAFLSTHFRIPMDDA